MPRVFHPLVRSGGYVWFSKQIDTDAAQQFVSLKGPGLKGIYYYLAS